MQISMYINSPGGVVSSGMAIYDTMQVNRAFFSAFATFKTPQLFPNTSFCTCQIRQKEVLHISGMSQELPVAFGCTPCGSHWTAQMMWPKASWQRLSIAVHKESHIHALHGSSRLDGLPLTLCWREGQAALPPPCPHHAASALWRISGILQNFLTALSLSSSILLFILTSCYQIAWLTLKFRVLLLSS